MKKYTKYLISAVIFFTVYTLIEYLLTKNLYWIDAIITTIMYSVCYTSIDLIFNKKLSKK